ncbi:exocyst complex component exo84 [Naganishia albida]|nr:exocyst complex component exo84 [Naganishia albida]
MSSLRTRRASQFPPQQTTSAFQRGLNALPEIPEIPVHHIPSSSLYPSSIPSAGYAPRSGSSTKRTPSYVRRADVARETDGRDKRRMSRVGEKIKKRLSLRYNDPLASADTPPIPSGESSALGTPQKSSIQFGVGDVIPTTSYSRLAPPGADAVDVLNNKFASYSLGSDGLKGSKGYARRTSHFDSRPSLVSTRPSAGTAFTGIEEEDEEPEVAVIRQAGEQQQWDLEPLQDSNVDLNAFIKDTLEGAEEDEVESFKQALQKRKAENAEQLKRNVFQNYGDFVTVSKEISTLENEMLELKDLISEWKTVPELLNNGVDPTTDPGITPSSNPNNLERRKTVRNSILDLQNMYRAQLQSLWTQISGSQKYLPITPGRHLVCEASSFIELNPATYKAKQLVELFLLNDLMLIAVRKRKRGIADSQTGGGRRGATIGGESDGGHLIAERCFTLSEITVADIKDSGDLTNAIKVKRGKETYVYRTNRTEDKRALLMAFRQVADELREKKREQSEKEQERRKSMWTGEAMPRITPVPRVPRIPAALAAADGMPTDSSSIDSFEDDLAMAIALKDWKQSVELVIRARGYLASALAKSLPDPSIAARLAALARELVDQIALDLSDPDIRRSDVITLSAHLARLQESQAASNAFLRARKELLGKRTRMIGYHGDVPAYISELAIVTFTILRHTSDWYLAAFPDNSLVSCFVEWCQSQITHFAESFRRQVYGPAEDPTVIRDSLTVVAFHNRKLMREVGLDFTFLMSTLLQPNWDAPDVQPNQIIRDLSVVPRTPKDRGEGKMRAEAA